MTESIICKGKELFFIASRSSFLDLVRIFYHSEMAPRRRSEEDLTRVIIIIIIIHRSLPVFTPSFASRYRWPLDRSGLLTWLNEDALTSLSKTTAAVCKLVTVVYRGHLFLSQPARRRQIRSWGREAGERVDVTRIRACETYKIDLSLSCLAAVWTVDCHRGKYYYLPRIPAADYRFRVGLALQQAL